MNGLEIEKMVRGVGMFAKDWGINTEDEVFGMRNPAKEALDWLTTSVMSKDAKFNHLYVQEDNKKVLVSIIEIKDNSFVNSSDIPTHLAVLGFDQPPIQQEATKDLSNIVSRRVFVRRGAAPE